MNIINKIVLFITITTLFLFLTDSSLAQNEFIINLSANISKIIDEQPIKCNISIGIELPEKIYEYKEKVLFQNTLTNSSLDFQIEYWVENLFGAIVKKKITTLNLNEKSFTPKFEGSQATFIIKNRLITQCDNVGLTKSESLFVVKNKNFIDNVKETPIPLTNPKIISFYTRTKKYSKIIPLYANIKGTGILKIFSNDNNQTLKINDSGTYQINVSVKQGKNKYLLFLFSKDVLVDFKDIEVTFEKTNISNAFQDKNETRAQITNISQNTTMPLLKESKQYNQPNKSLITGEVIFETKNEKIKKQIPYFLIVILSLLSGFLIFKKNF